MPGLQCALALAPYLALCGQSPVDTLRYFCFGRFFRLWLQCHDGRMRTLRQLNGSAMPRYATLDVGSNTVKLLIAERDGDGRFVPVIDTSRQTRLGEGIHLRRLREVAIRRTLDVFQEFAALCREHKVEHIAAVGTSALRDAVNKDELIDRARELGIDLEAIPGEEEARLSFSAVQRDPLWRHAERLLVIDIGGGSTEIILGDLMGVQSRVSLQMGAVRLTEAALPSDPPTVQQMVEANHIAEKALQNLMPPGPGSLLVGVGGTLTNMGRVALQLPVGQQDARLHGVCMSLETVEAQVEGYAARTVAERREIVGLDPARADIILGGAIILCQVLFKSALDSVTVSTRGLRWGLLYDRFGTS